ncbi:MAG: CotH kinase family protein, partial [Clostridiales bacterium]|nr:CotH kinase family protein [Clostridiales bacterium]
YIYTIGESSLQYKEGSVSKSIAAGYDDIRTTGSTVYPSETRLYLNGKNGSADATNYLRFTNINLPEDAIITNAYLTFTTRLDTTGASKFAVSGETSDNGAFTANMNSINNRQFTSASVTSQTPANLRQQALFSTGDISGIISEMRGANIDRTSYVFKIDGDKTGDFIAVAYEGDEPEPRLTIEYLSSSGKVEATGTNTNDAVEETGITHTMDMGSNIDIGGYLGTAKTLQNKLVTGLRFPNVDLPADVEITDAYIEFTTAWAGNAAANMKIWAQKGSAAIYTTAAYNVSDRPYGYYSVEWTQPRLATVGQVFRTPNLRDLIDENRLSGWQSGQAMAFMVDGDGMVGDIYDAGTANAPKLVIEYQYNGKGAYIAAADPEKIHTAIAPSSKWSDTAEECGEQNGVVRDNMEIGGYFDVIETPAYRSIAGFRFNNVMIPEDAEIVDAYMTFTTNRLGPTNAVANMVIKGELGNPATYGVNQYEITARRYGESAVRYQLASIRTSLQEIRTPNLKELIDENRVSGWQSGQALAFMVDGDQHIGDVYRSETAYTPRLTVTYKMNGKGANIPEAVSDPELINNVFINEIAGMGSGASKDTWFELYNANDFPVLLDEGMYISNKASKLDKFEFDNLMIPAKGFRAVICPEDEVNKPGYTDFELDKKGTLYLSAKKAGKITTIDSVSYAELLYNQTAGRKTDGGSEIILFQKESFAAPNAMGQRNYQVNVSHKRGVYDGGFTLTISSSNPSATIKYSIDGVTTPSETKGTVYTRPISISRSGVVKVYVYDSLGNSGLQAYTYVLKNNLVNEVRSGNKWVYKGNINSAEYAKAVSSFPIISVTSNSGIAPQPYEDYIQTTFEYIDSHLGKGDNDYFSNSGAKKFGQAGMTLENGNTTVKFHRDYNTTKAKVNFFEPVPNDAFPTPGKYSTLQLKEGQDGPQMDIRSLGYLRYDDSVAYTLGINMGKYSLKTRYVQYYLNGQYMGLKTLRENFSDGSFENAFGDDGDHYTKITFQDDSFTTGIVESGDGDAALYTKIKKSVNDKNFQEFKKYVDVNDFIQAQILFMFVDTENEMEGILHNDAYTGGGVKMITNVNDLDGAFFNDGHTGTGAYFFDGGGGNYRFKWTNATSRRGAGGWFAAFSGDSTSTAMNGNLEFKTLVKDQVLKQFGTNGRGSTPLSVENVQALIQKNYDALYHSSAYKVDAAFMGMRST